MDGKKVLEYTKFVITIMEMAKKKGFKINVVGEEIRVRYPNFNEEVVVESEGEIASIFQHILDWK